MKNYGFKDIILLEDKTIVVLSETRNCIVEKIKNTQINNVEQINDFMCVVRLKSLTSSWSPELYLSNVQAMNVDKALAACKTAKAFIEKIRSMISEKKVKINSNYYYFNNTTIKILKEFLEKNEI